MTVYQPRRKTEIQTIRYDEWYQEQQVLKILKAPSKQ